MQVKRVRTVEVESHFINSVFLKRKVTIDCYVPMLKSPKEAISMLLINDGQDLPRMPFDEILNGLYEENKIAPVFCVGIYCSADRKNEYGTAKHLDYKGRGAKAMAYNFFIFKELLPFLNLNYSRFIFKNKSFAGFSLGGLSAMDICWNHGNEFTYVGVFSGSMWWRNKSHEAADFDEDKNRLMHLQVREGTYHPGLKFFFEVGTQDETGDRNNNGIIDSIDDTLSLIAELTAKGYDENSIVYLEMEDGCHDVPTWAKAFPSFLEWAFGLNDSRN